MGLSINNCGVGIDISSGGPTAQAVGSVLIIDSHISDTPVGIKTARTSNSVPNTGGSLVLESVLFTNVATAIQYPSSAVGTGSGTRIAPAFVAGNTYSSTGRTSTQGIIQPFPRPNTLLGGDGHYYTRSKPQYENLPAAQFASVRESGAKGDGKTDDTAALQSIINSATQAGKVVFFDTGVYKVTNTLQIPAGAKIVGESYPVIMASGAYFQNMNAPVPVVRVGAQDGEAGVVEWSDMVVSTQGPSAGAILISWNLSSPPKTPSGMWDVHTRIGGFAGSDLQLSNCPITASQPQQQCIAAFQSMHITEAAGGLYMENVWLWSADHDIDDATNTKITVYSGRGLHIESKTGNIWL